MHKEKWILDLRSGLASGPETFALFHAMVRRPKQPIFHRKSSRLILDLSKRDFIARCSQFITTYLIQETS